MKAIYKDCPFKALPKYLHNKHITFHKYIKLYYIQFTDINSQVTYPSSKEIKHLLSAILMSNSLPYIGGKKEEEKGGKGCNFHYKLFLLFIFLIG